LPTNDPEARMFVSDIIGYLSGYAHLTDARSLALVAVAGAEKEDAGETAEANGTTTTVGPADGF
jgi:hypothetical protein